MPSPLPPLTRSLPSALTIFRCARLVLPIATPALSLTCALLSSHEALTRPPLVHPCPRFAPCAPCPCRLACAMGCYRPSLYWLYRRVVCHPLASHSLSMNTQSIDVSSSIGLPITVPVPYGVTMSARELAIYSRAIYASRVRTWRALAPLSASCDVVPDDIITLARFDAQDRRVAAGV